MPSRGATLASLGGPQRGSEQFVWKAVSDALRPVLHLETEWQVHKLQKRICDYLRKACRGLDFAGSAWHELLMDCAFSFYGSIFQALGDRPWINRVDFVLALDAVVAELFPPAIFEDVPPELVERGILACHDQAFEEQRHLGSLWLVVLRQVECWAQKRAYEAASIGRKRAIERVRGDTGASAAKQFVSRWIDGTVRHLSKTTHGDPGEILPEKAAPKFFRSLLDEAFAMPIAIDAQYGPPPKDWPFLGYAVRVAYASHDYTRRSDWQPPLKKFRLESKAETWRPDQEDADEEWQPPVKKSKLESKAETSKPDQEEPDEEWLAGLDDEVVALIKSAKRECKAELARVEDWVMDSNELAEDMLAEAVEPPE